MTDVRVTQASSEVLLSPARPTAKLTQLTSEVLLTPARPSVKVTQGAIEVLHNDTSEPPGPPYPEDAGSVRTTQAATLALTEGTPDARVTQAAAMVMYSPGAAMRTTQAMALTLAEFDADERITQVAALALVDHVPCLTRWAQCWTITRTDGQVFAFTSTDRALTFRGVSHKPCDSLSASATELSAVQGSTGNMDLSGVLSDSSITEDDLFGGKFDGAYVEIWLVPWQNTTGETPIRLLAGKTGDTKQGVLQFTAEIITPGADIQQRPLLDTYTPGCRYKLGDSRCTVDLSTFEVSGTVTALTIATAPNSANKRIFIDSSRVEDSGYFDLGEITWTSGDNNGITSEVKTFDGSTFVLWGPLLHPIQIGDTYTATPGCDKAPVTCKDKFSNKVNYGGFEFIPGQDAVLFAPDAK